MDTLPVEAILETEAALLLELHGLVRNAVRSARRVLRGVEMIHLFFVSGGVGNGVIN